jgi:hypothetical protein
MYRRTACGCAPPVYSARSVSENCRRTNGYMLWSRNVRQNTVALAILYPHTTLRIPRGATMSFADLRASLRANYRYRNHLEWK